MTASELWKDHLIPQEVISRAVRAGEVLDEAVVREGNRFVTLYYVDERQLEMRTDKDVYLPRSGLEESEEKSITQYLDVHCHELFIWLGNAEKELALSLTGDIPICTRRRDLLLQLAKKRGIEVRDGYDETISVVGSKRWWSLHTDNVVKEAEEFLGGLPLGFRIPKKDDLFSYYQKAVRLAFGCRVGGILYPGYHRRLINGKLNELLKTPALQHATIENRLELRNLFNEAVEHCQAALTMTEEIWKEVERTVTSLFIEAKWNVTEPDPTFLAAIYFLYNLIYQKAIGLVILQFEVEPTRKMIVYPDFQGKKHSQTMLLDTRGAMDLDDLGQWAERLNNLVKLNPLHMKVLDSMREVRLSNEKLCESIDRIQRLTQTWKTEGLSGECDICRGVMPRPDRPEPR